MADAQELPPGPCNTGDTLVRVARCVEGVWQLGWVSATEFETLAVAAENPILAAINKGWKPSEVIKLAETLKASKPCQ